jgi:transposase-like protein
MFMRHKWLDVSWARCVLRDMRWRFTLSYRDVEDLLAERALDVMSRNLVAFFVRQCDKATKPVRHISATIEES